MITWRKSSSKRDIRAEGQITWGGQVTAQGLPVVEKCNLHLERDIVDRGRDNWDGRINEMVGGGNDGGGANKGGNVNAEGASNGEWAYTGGQQL